VRRIMALLARQPRVLSFQRIAGLGVIESLFGRFPVNDLEFHAVVFGVAANALLVVGLRDENRVIAAMGSDALGNLSVAFEALEVLIPTCKSVAGRAVRRPTQKLVRSGEGAG
jgi:hypothetical protein